MISEQIYTMTWASWGSIFAGGATAIAISIVMKFLGIALGFTVVSPKSDDPASGLGVAFGFWAIFSVVASMAGGGFIAGLFAGQKGLEHGFLVWAVVTITATVFTLIFMGSVLRMLGAMVKSLGSGTADVAGAISRGAAQAVSGAVSELRESVDLSLDLDGINDTLKTVLRDTGIDTLRPEFLQEQMRAARSDLRASLYQISLTPADSDRIIAKFLETEKARLESLAGGIDRETAAKALAEKRNIPLEDAERMVDNALAAYEQCLQKAKDALAEAKAQVRDAREYLKGLADSAREKADSFASSAARAALGVASALILAAVVSMGAGWCGTAYAPAWNMIQKTYIVG